MRLLKHSGRDMQRQGIAVRLEALLQSLATHRESEARELYRELVKHPALRGILSPPANEVAPLSGLKK